MLYNVISAITLN